MYGTEMVIDYKQLLNLYKRKRVLITGNTGFKGSWLTHILIDAEAEAIGYSLQPSTVPNFFRLQDLLVTTNFIRSMLI